METLIRPEPLVYPKVIVDFLAARNRERFGAAQMAITVSGLYVPTFADAWDTTQLALDLDLDTHKLALFSNTITPNFSTDTAFGVAPYNANEVTGTNWAAGGVTLATATLTESPAGSLMFDAADISVANATFTGARGALIYADVLAGNNAICLLNFGSDFSPSAGTFQINFASGGIFALDITP